MQKWVFSLSWPRTFAKTLRTWSRELSWQHQRANNHFVTEKKWKNSTPIHKMCLGMKEQCHHRQQRNGSKSSAELPSTSRTSFVRGHPTNQMWRRHGTCQQSTCGTTTTCCVVTDDFHGVLTNFFAVYRGHCRHTCTCEQCISLRVGRTPPEIPFLIMPMSRPPANEN